MGIASCIPLFLKERVGLADIATFAASSWPYGLKLFWAPLGACLSMSRVVVVIISAA